MALASQCQWHCYMSADQNSIRELLLTLPSDTSPPPMMGLLMSNVLLHNREGESFSILISDGSEMSTLSCDPIVKMLSVVRW